MILQMYISCYFGNLVKEKSLQLSASMYESNWMQQSKKWSQSLLIIGERLKKPIVPSAGRSLFAIDMPTFFSVNWICFSLKIF